MFGIGVDELRKLQSMEKYIITMVNHRSWYYKDIDELPEVTGIVWTPYIRLAHLFYNEQDVEEFKMNFISPRKVNILRIR